MCREIYLSVFITMLSAGFCSGSTWVFWNGWDANNPNWSSETNWLDGNVPSVNDIVAINPTAAQPLIEVGTAAIAETVIVGHNGCGDASLTMTSGTLTIGKPDGYFNRLAIGRSLVGESTLNLHGGTINLTGDGTFVICGYQQKGIINITGGILNCNAFLRVGKFYNSTDWPDSNGFINLSGGVITTDELEMIGSGRIDIKAGTLILDGDHIAQIEGYVNEPNKWITADSGNGKLIIDYDLRNPGKTTVSAISTNSAFPKLTVNIDPCDIGIDSIIPSIEQVIYYWPNEPISIAATSFKKCPNVYRFDHWEGDIDPDSDPNVPFTKIIMNYDKTVRAVFYQDAQKCGDECHPILQGDLDENCHIDFNDFAIYCQQWMACTHPDCNYVLPEP